MYDYLISGKGFKMFFDGSVYQNPDEAAVEEGKRYEKVFKNIKVFKIGVAKPLYTAKKETEKRSLKFQACFCPLPRRCHCV